MGASPILLGVIGRPHGVRGQVRVRSYTARPSDLAAYGPLADGQGRGYRLHMLGEDIAELFVQEPAGERRIADRNEAERLTNTALYVDRSVLPSAEEDEFYLADLVGLTATSEHGASLGPVRAVHDYGAGASLELADGTLLPFTRACVPSIDLQAGRLTIVPPVTVEAPGAGGAVS